MKSETLKITLRSSGLSKYIFSEQWTIEEYYLIKQFYVNSEKHITKTFYEGDE